MLIRRTSSSDDPDINFIPLIDVLLVIVIFLAVSTTFTQERVMEVLLPKALTQAEVPTAIELTISSEGQMAINDRVLPEITVQAIAAALSSVAKGEDVAVVIRADANATHQAVVTAMQAASRAGIQKLSFAAQVAD
ncbi:ExbD/TolR family protein [Orrella daihaiensis]|uniref:Biopolymer transporter ExbD n=1 Tax=Orrella daihaiensis TaxID=2782176 RepID=A0ABY4AG23_9BURK|nr:biopolymer transporter ExbD [Orrella daihaiensis]UOD49247.1 biopolymer transporter ExbD [Orrella daihaiensis]